MPILGYKGVLDYFPAPRNIGEHIFLYQKVGCSKRKVQHGCVRYGPQRIMRRDTHPVDFGHSGDLASLP